MLITPRPGANRESLLEDLRSRHISALNALNIHFVTAHERLLHYLEWATEASRHLLPHISKNDAEQLVLTRLYYTLLQSSGTLTGKAEQLLVNNLVHFALSESCDALKAAADSLERQISRWSGPETFVVADSSFWIQHPEKLEDIDFPKLLGVMPDDGIHLLFPIVIIDELDRLKESKDRRQRWRAGYTLACLDRVSGGRGVLRAADYSGIESGGSIRQAVTVEIVLDPPGHDPLPSADDEIIDRTMAIQALAGREVRLLTYDTGQSTRGRMAQLRVEKFRTDAGTGDEPDWEAEEARQGNGTRAKRRARQAEREKEQDSGDGQSS